MTPEQFREFRQSIGVSQKTMATVLGVTRRQVIRYESGEQSISGTAAVLLHILVTRKIPKFPKRSVRR